MTSCWSARMRCLPHRRALLQRSYVSISLFSPFVARCTPRVWTAIPQRRARSPHCDTARVRARQAGQNSRGMGPRIAEACVGTELWFAYTSRPASARFRAVITQAGVAELVDAPDSKSGFRKKVKVRFLSWAQGIILKWLIFSHFL